MSLSANDIANYQRDGVVCLRDVFDRAWLNKLATGIEKNFANPSDASSEYTPRENAGRFYDDYRNWQHIDEYREFIMESPAGEIAARLMESREARIYHEHVLIKEPGTAETTPWHHDLPYYGLAGEQLCSVWVPLDEVPARACPQFLKSSHRSGQLYYPRLFETAENYRPTSDSEITFHALPGDDELTTRYDVLFWDLAPGDCLVFDMRTVHGAPGTTGLTTRRRGFSTRWLGDDARFARRPWTTSPPFEDLNLNPGDVMDHELFPVVWPRN